ncbi:hypothetical protein K8Z61_11470 [Nocardioides sp. TRM66260-LWL]|uniref:hypothetical protein n=1 Tax=Nocardioides sp. TRM66260-LWL TaxID=2874478 RepID=UPI001CC73876|nr:hypothetical protein [Nocardioides sp. TRM66260-LWL]MBZ5735118.1 hypothetical protein [Nocardioides sp. TRM66260-LWL]
MTPPTARAEELARRLLDAQVAHHVERLTGDTLTVEVRALATELLAAAEAHPIADVVDVEAVADVVERALATVPPSAAVSGVIEMATTLVLDGPERPHAVGALVDRPQVERIVDAVLALHPLVEQRLDRLAEAPTVGVVASRFMGRIVGEVLEANKAVAGKVPGLGSLVSLGTGAATKVIGAADKQLDGLLGDAAGRGGALAVRRLNRILVETLRDPATRDAVLQVWDLVAAERVAGVDDPDARTRLVAVVDAAHEAVVVAAGTPEAAALGRTVVEAFFERFGGYTGPELLDELDLDRDALLDDVERLAPPVVRALHDSGALERLLRARLAPFHADPATLALLEDALG